MKKRSFSNNKTSKNKEFSLQNKSYQNEKSSKDYKGEIPIIDLLKCPICKNICLININRDKLLFSFECNNDHNASLKKSKTYLNTNENYLNSNISELNFIPEKHILKILNKDNNTSYPEYNYGTKQLNNNQKIYITENDFSCSKHKINYSVYCYECKENICEKCNKEHLNHNKIILKAIKPKKDEVISCKNEINKKEEELNNIIEKMMKWKKEFEYGLNTLIKIMQNISNLRQFIIMNYDLRQSNQNYNYIQNFKHMKVLDFIFPELQEFFKEKQWKKKGFKLIEIITNIQKSINENKEQIKFKKLKEEIDYSKTDILKKKFDVQDKIIVKKFNNKKIGINGGGIIDMESVSSKHYSMKKNYNTIFSSDCLNNNYFCRNVSRKMVKKTIENGNKEIDALSHCIGQIEKLENYNNNNGIIKESNKIQGINIYKNLTEDDEAKNRNLLSNNKNKPENIGENLIIYNINSNKEKNPNDNNNNIEKDNSRLFNIDSKKDSVKINDNNYNEVIENNDNLEESNENLINKTEKLKEDN